jgi:ribonuclease P protein component
VAAEIGRLKRQSDFTRLRGGPRWAMPGMVLEGRLRGPAEPIHPNVARFGYRASKAAIGGAVQRNRARRRLKEAVRLLAPSLAREGYDYLLIARPATLQRPFAELLKDLQTAFSRVHQRSLSKGARGSS